jgi:tol-pal system protein YbgF
VITIDAPPAVILMPIRLLVAALAVLLLLPGRAGAQNREHIQLTADLRIVQEQVNRLQLTANLLAEQLEKTNARIDAVSEANVKASANLQLLINQVNSQVTTTSENLRENSVRVSQLTQEMSAIREGVRMLTDQINTLVSALQPAVNPLDPNAPPGTPQAGGGGLAPLSLPESPTRYFDQAERDFFAGNYDSAIEGFREVLSKFPDTPAAAEAQFLLGETYYQQGKFRDAIPEYQKVITNHKESDKLPDAYLMQGMCYEALKQTANATKTYQQLIKLYPNSAQKILGEQRLKAMGVIK